MSATTRRERAPRRDAELTFLRPIPGDTVVHRLWAGTKLLVAGGLALSLSIAPTWKMLGVGSAVVVLALVVARIPLGAFPRLPRWFYIALLVNALLDLWSGIHPVTHVAGVELSIGGISEWARFLLLAAVLMISGAVIGWTTPLGEVAPALRRLGAPLRVLRLPVDEWVLAIALSIRCLPLLIDEIRTLNAARRLRANNHERGPQSFRQLVVETHELLATAIVSAMRRARDLADALTARGGVGGAAGAIDRGPRAVDYAVIAGAAALYVVCLAVLHL